MTISLKADASGTFGTLQVGGVDKLRIGSDSSGQLAGFRNVLINADFRINQRAYASAAVLVTSAYAHDRWKAGASGGDYTFTQLPSATQITLAASKSLIQVVEDKNVVGGSYILSWVGTAQARVGLNSATPSGSYAASPILITGQTAGTTMSVEFNTGTLSKAQLEEGSIATPFESRPIGLELSLCQRYFQRVDGRSYIYRPTAGDSTYETKMLVVPMRSVPTVAKTGTYTYTNTSAGAYVWSANTNYAIKLVANSTTGSPSISGVASAATVDLDAEL